MFEAGRSPAEPPEAALNAHRAGDRSRPDLAGTDVKRQAPSLRPPAGSATASSGLDVRVRGLARATRSHLAEPLFRNAYALILAELLTSGLGIIFWAVAARLYSTQDVGRGAAVIAAMLTLANFAQLNLPIGFLRFLPRAGASSGMFVRRAYAVTVVVGVVLAVAFVVIAPTVSQSLSFLAGSPALAAAVVVGVPLWCLFALQDAALTATRNAAWVPVENGLFSAGKLLLLVMLAAVLPTQGIVVSWLVAMVLAVPLVNMYLFGRVLPRHSETRTGTGPLHLRNVARFVSADYVGSLFAHLCTTALPLLVVSLLGADANALFFVAWTLGTSLTLIASNTGYSLMVEATTDEARLAEHGRRSLRRCLELVSVGAAAMALLAPWALAVFGPQYQAASDLLRILAVAAVLASINLMYLALMRVKRRLRRVVVVQAAECAAMLTITVLIAPRASIEGVGVAFLVTQALVCAAILPDLRRVLRDTPVVEEALR